MNATTAKWDDQRIKRDRVALLQAEMKRQGVGALYLNGGVTQWYAMSLKVPGAKVFIPAEGEAIVFVRPRDEGYVSMQFENIRPPLSRGPRGVVAETKGTSPFARGLLDVMMEHGLAGEKLGIDVMEVGVVLDLAQAGLNLVDADPVIERTWTVKTDDEAEIYRATGDAYVTTFKAFQAAVRPGVTEKQLADVVTSSWQECMGEEVCQLNVCSGENMNPWRRWPSDRALKSGEFVGVDLHARGATGLRGDSSTTFLVGDRPTAEQRDLYQRANDYLRATTPVWRAGRTIADAMADVPTVPEQFRKKLWDLNYAHGCGMGSSGYPHMDPRRDPLDDVLRRNQVLSLEVYFGEVGSPVAVKLEQMVLIRDGEPELIGPIPMDDRLIG